jgi:NADH-quinone oxidoreductase subunit E
MAELQKQQAAEETLDLAPLDEILEKYAGKKGVVIPILQETQAVFGYLPRQALEYISRKMHIPLSDLYGVATFYAQFYLTRRGKHIIRCCDGTACHVRGASKIIDTLQSQLGIKPGETTPDYEYTLEVVYCLGSCGLSPVAVVDGTVYGHLTPQKMLEILQSVA